MVQIPLIIFHLFNNHIREKLWLYIKITLDNFSDVNADFDERQKQVDWNHQIDKSVYRETKVVKMVNDPDTGSTGDKPSSSEARPKEGKVTTSMSLVCVIAISGYNDMSFINSE